MIYRVLADVTLLIHFTFVLFVIFGGFLALRWMRIAWVHVPAAIWGALIEFADWPCPLTPLENWLRRRGGEALYAGGFVEHYVMALIYPEGLPRRVQILLGLGVIIINVIAYALFASRRTGATRWR
jgi:uncharacterized protein DUF2784